MTTIVTRATKGSALTWTEGDANITNLNNDKIEFTDLSVSTGSASGGGSLTYNNTTGEFSFTPADVSASGISLTDLSVGTEGSASGDGSISYNNSTGVFTYTPPTASGIGALANISEDTTPQLGGTLDCQGNIVSDSTLKDYKETIHSLGSTDSPTITISNGNIQSVTITSGLSLSAFSDAASGQSVTLLVTGSGTATGTGSHKFASGATTLTSYSVVSIFYDGTTYWTSIATDFQ